MIRIRYFAWLRERTGVAEEDIVLPDEVRTVADLIRHLAARDEGYAYAFERPEILRAAIDQRHVSAETGLAGAREVAFFPPMTGG